MRHFFTAKKDKGLFTGLPPYSITYFKNNSFNMIGNFSNLLIYKGGLIIERHKSGIYHGLKPHYENSFGSKYWYDKYWNRYDSYERYLIGTI